jgi:hypothetical protein
MCHHLRRIATTPVVIETTGMGKRWRKDLRHAERKQQMGMVMAPMMKDHAATMRLPRGR